MSERPKFSSEIARLAAEEVVSELVRNQLLTETERSDAIDGIAKHGRPYIDGYELAKALDDFEGWDCNFEIAEVLEGFWSSCDAVLRKAQKQWAAAESIAPPLAVGTRVTFSRGRAGVIDGIYEHGAAQYLIKVDGDPLTDSPSKSRSIINFEDIKAEAAAA